MEHNEDFGQNEKESKLILRFVTLFLNFEHFISALLVFLIAIALLIGIMCFVAFPFVAILGKLLGATTISYDDFQNLLGGIMSSLIVLELMNSIVSVLRKYDLLQLAKNISLIAALAICRKLIVLDYSNKDSSMIFALAIIILCLGGFYFLVSRPSRQA